MIIKCIWLYRYIRANNMLTCTNYYSVKNWLQTNILRGPPWIYLKVGWKLLLPTMIHHCLESQGERFWSDTGHSTIPGLAQILKGSHHQYRLSFSVRRLEIHWTLEVWQWKWPITVNKSMAPGFWGARRCCQCWDILHGEEKRAAFEKLLICCQPSVQLSSCTRLRSSHEEYVSTAKANCTSNQAGRHSLFLWPPHPTPRVA